MGEQRFRTRAARFLSSLWCLGSGEHDNSTLYGSEQSTLVNCDAVCHIQRLPDPVLGAIFALGKDFEKETSVEHIVPPLERIVSQVAVRWRVVALGLPDLWSSVDAHVRPEHQRALLEWYLAHSEGRPLDVSISLSQENWNTEGKLILADVLAEASRLRRLCIRADFLGADAAVQDACRYLCAPMLEHLSFISLEPPLSWREPDDYIYEENFSPVVFTRGVERLAVLRLQHLEDALYPPLRSVTTLHLEEYRSPPMAYTRFLALLKALPALANLSLYGNVVASWPVAGALHLPRLRSLRSASNDRQACMLGALDAPVLDSITLKDARVAGLKYGGGLRLPALRTVTLDGSFSARELGTLFCELGASVSELRLVNCDADDALELLTHRDLLPGLKTMMVHQMRCAAALDNAWARGVAVSLHVDVPWAETGTTRWTGLPPWPAEMHRVDADDLFMQLRRTARR